MSLGPPFDDSGERLRLGIGAAAGAVLLFGIAFALLAAERPLGDSITILVKVARPGALRTGAALRVAGVAIGEVVAIRGQPAPLGKETPAIDIEIRLQKAYRDRVFRNSTIVPINPTILTEAVLEVGPPANGAAPSEPVQDADRLRGVDPADIDQFMLKLYLGIESVLSETRDLRPEWEDLSRSLVALSTRVATTLPGDELLRVGLHVAVSRAKAENLIAKLRAAGIDAGPAELRGLVQMSQPPIRELERLAERLEVLDGQVRDFAVPLAARQGELRRALAGLRSVAALGTRTEADIAALLDGYAAGRGTMGGFHRDIQIFDELKEVHRILKRRSWRILIKKADPGQRDVR